MEYIEIKENQIMRKCDLLRGIYYAGYYDEDRKLHIDIDSENAKDVIAKIMGADIVHLKY